MEVNDWVLADVVHLMNLYLVWRYGLDTLDTNLQPGEFHVMDQKLDKCYLTTICIGGQYVPMVVDNQ